MTPCNGILCLIALLTIFINSIAPNYIIKNPMVDRKTALNVR